MEVTAEANNGESKTVTRAVIISNVTDSCENVLRVYPPSVTLRDGRTEETLCVVHRDPMGDPILTSLNLGICKQSRKIEQAVDFLMFLSSKSSMERWIVDGDRIAPLRNIEPNPWVAAFAPP